MFNNKCGAVLILVQELTRLGLSFVRGGLDGRDRLLGNIHRFSSSLHTLVLEFYCACASPILALDFPRLQSLTLGMFSLSDTSEAMAFSAASSSHREVEAYEY